jgi:release factor glutamine methyltransferase
VLIPRPETEELVDWILREERGRASDILDIGTGSGCIAVSLAVNLPGAAVAACDISGDALTVARRNAQSNRANVSFFRLDMLDSRVALPDRYQVMVSNPPYVREQEKDFMRRNVLDFEPGIALFVPDNDPLCYYRNIALLGRKYLKEGGMLYLEINENFALETVRLLESAGFYGLEVRPDIRGKARMVQARK